MNSYTKVGTNRYISPEVLGSSPEDMEFMEFTNYKQADVYSFGLVLWELCRRTIKDVSQLSLLNSSSLTDFHFQGVCDEFALPYNEYQVRSAPSDEEMTELVWKEV